MRDYPRIIQFWLFLLLTAYLSLTSGSPETLAMFSDKILHCVGYFLLMLSCDLAYFPKQKLPGKILFLLGFSVIIEAIQYFIPHRELSGLDIIANLTGLTWGLLVIVFLKPKVEKVAEKDM